MGNQCVITTRENFQNNGVGLYLHWFGDVTCVTAFLQYCELKGYRPPDIDSSGFARMCQIIGNFFGSTLMLKIDTLDKLDYQNCDAGVYIIHGWSIESHEGVANPSSPDSTLKWLIDIDNSQPENDRLGEYLTGVDVDVGNLKVGDTICMVTWEGKVKKTTILGFGEDIVVKGVNVHGIPYGQVYAGPLDLDKNLKNYIRTPNVRLLGG